MNQEKWLEIWIDLGLAPPYLLLLEKTGNDILISDPQKQGAIIKRFDSYEDAKMWLLEDEYTQVDGRIENDDTW